jgi:hypothetical protein
VRPLRLLINALILLDMRQILVFNGRNEMDGSEGAKGLDDETKHEFFNS